ncbi:hypothetical protein TCAL_15608 [Tigriopus californicus]|uniref:Uncharacterized protein n=1 Tax=Tigriopus californicus TaxID=6832 RepID=A0A553PCC1_TIGCA|nr:hypothetical protein TCAL_15608 [Tigriopus californicus]
MDSLVLHQNPTLPLSDANSKSSASNNYSSVHRPKRRKKRLSRQPSKAVEESDSDCLPPTKRNEIGSKLDFSHWDPSPKKPFRPQHQVQIIQNYAKRHGRSQYDPDSTSFSSESGESSPDCGRSPLATPISEEERIFIKQNNGQFMALKPSQVMMHTHRRRYGFDGTWSTWELCEEHEPEEIASLFPDLVPFANTRWLRRRVCQIYGDLKLNSNDTICSTKINGNGSQPIVVDEDGQYLQYEPCEVDYEPWPFHCFDHCSKSCNVGTCEIRRRCQLQDDLYRIVNDEECSHLGPTTKMSDCNMLPCDTGKI